MERDCVTNKCVKEISGETSVHSYILSERVITFPALTKIKEDDNFSSLWPPIYLGNVSLGILTNNEVEKKMINYIYIYFYISIRKFNFDNFLRSSFPYLVVYKYKTNRNPIGFVDIYRKKK